MVDIQTVINIGITCYLGGIFTILLAIKLFAQAQYKSLKSEGVNQHQTLIVKNGLHDEAKEIVTSQSKALILYPKPFEYVVSTASTTTHKCLVTQVKKASVDPCVLKKTKKLNGRSLRASLNIIKDLSLKEHFLIEAILESKRLSLSSRTVTTLSRFPSLPNRRQLVASTIVAPSKQIEKPEIKTICRPAIELRNRINSNTENSWISIFNLRKGVILNLKVSTLLEEITSAIIEKDEEFIPSYYPVQETWDKIKDSFLSLELLPRSKMSLKLQSMVIAPRSHPRRSALIEVGNISVAKIKTKLITYGSTSHFKHTLKNHEAMLIQKTLRQETIMDGRLFHDLQRFLGFRIFRNIHIIIPPKRKPKLLLYKDHTFSKPKSTSTKAIAMHKSSFFKSKQSVIAGFRNGPINEMFLNMDKKSHQDHDSKNLLVANHANSTCNSENSDPVSHEKLSFDQTFDSDNKARLNDENPCASPQHLKYEYIHHQASKSGKKEELDIGEMCFNGPNAAASSRHDAAYEKFLEQAAELRLTEEEEPEIFDNQAAKMRLAARRLGRSLGWDWDGTPIRPEMGEMTSDIIVN
ncbi:hypothetical protein G9A89_010516 [Geosiphon pyriformis]|nr:hypothetical protein G9A89_010516 [Geosiphon pyriformis]